MWGGQQEESTKAQERETIKRIKVPGTLGFIKILLKKSDKYSNC